jgi:hypothetical protein
VTETATSDPVFTSATPRTGTFLTPTSADLSDLMVIARTHPIGSNGSIPGIPYYLEVTEIDGKPVQVAGPRASDVVELACVMRGEPIPVELRELAHAYELREEALVLYKKKDTEMVS